MKKYIKLNNNNNHLSIGNLCRIIKEYSINKSSAIQSEIFCIIFNLDKVNDTTINNYCIGIRSINNDYKQIYINLKKNYNKDKYVLIDIILNLIDIMNGKISNISKNNDKLTFINNNQLFSKATYKLYNIAKNDKDVSNDLILEIKNYLENNDYYSAFNKMLFFIILEKKQPIYEDSLKSEVIENILKTSIISSSELEEFLLFKFRDSTNYNYEIKKLAKKGNAYASYEMGTDEYYGYTTGYPRYDISFKYLSIAASKGHPSANYLIANMFLRGNIGGLKSEDTKLAYDYLVKAKELGSIEAINTIGNMYLNGIYPLKKNINKAKECYIEAASKNYAYAFNNLGKLEEKNKNYQKALEYFTKSADLGESWASNKVGEYYRLGIVEKDLNKAFIYYNKAIDTNKRNLCNYALYNLAKYYYLDGCSDIVLISNKELAINYLKQASNNNLIEASILLVTIYSKYYYDTNDSKYLDLINELIPKIENNPLYTIDIKNEVENNIKHIKKHININI